MAGTTRHWAGTTGADLRASKHFGGEVASAFPSRSRFQRRSRKKGQLLIFVTGVEKVFYDHRLPPPAGLGGGLSSLHIMQDLL